MFFSRYQNDHVFRQFQISLIPEFCTSGFFSCRVHLPVNIWRRTSGNSIIMVIGAAQGTPNTDEETTAKSIPNVSHLSNDRWHLLQFLYVRYTWCHITENLGILWRKSKKALCHTAAVTCAAYMIWAHHRLKQFTPIISVSFYCDMHMVRSHQLISVISEQPDINCPKTPISRSSVNAYTCSRHVKPVCVRHRDQSMDNIKSTAHSWNCF
jgi:hypothetical protein